MTDKQNQQAGIVRGHGGKFITTGGRPKGTPNKRRTVSIPNHMSEKADLITRLLYEEGEKSMREIIKSVAEKAKVDAAIGISFAKLVVPVPRKFVPMGVEEYPATPFVDRPEILLRLVSERVLDIESAKFLLDVHRQQMEHGFAKTLRSQLDKFNRGEIDMPAMLQALGDALMAHEAHTFESEGDGDAE